MVHRLDMNTSGLMVVGLTPESQRFLSQEFEARRVSKRYIALLDGVVEPSEGVISLPLRLDVDRRPFQIVDFIHGKRALTQYRVLARSSASTRIEFSPLTGRTHQLRVHAAVPPHRYAHDPARPADASAGGLGCPIRGDMLYGDAATAPRLMLHASYLAFRSPETLEQVEFFRTDALGDP
jgi:tRNA pseudouridine32 synthase/23S rRNA pseudouridine746 synthase